MDNPWLTAICLALGVFFGNWLAIPLVLKKRSFRQGFLIGVIAAILVLLSFAVINFFRSAN